MRTSFPPDAIVKIRFGTLLTDIMTAVHTGALNRECIVPDVAVKITAKIATQMVRSNHLTLVSEDTPNED